MIMTGNSIYNRMKKCISVVMFLLLSVAAVAQNYQQYAIRLGSAYMAHVKVGSEWQVQAKTLFDDDCIWLSDKHNYCFEDENGIMKYLHADVFTAGSSLVIGDQPSAELLRQNSIGVDPSEVHTYYFYDWDVTRLTGRYIGMALGRQLNCGPSDPLCLPEYNNTSTTECWECYWVVYNGSNFSLASEASYEPPTAAVTLCRVNVNRHDINVISSTGGIGDIAGGTISSPSGSLPVAQPSYSPYADIIQPSYTTYQIGEILLHGNWPDRTEEALWTIHNVFGGADHGSAVPSQETHTSHDAPTAANYTWTLSGDGASYISFSASDDITEISGVTTPTVYFRTPLTSGDMTATLTLTVEHPTVSGSDQCGATQVRTATISLTTECGNPRVSLVSTSGNEATISWLPTIPSSEPTRIYKVRYYYYEYESEYLGATFDVENPTECTYTLTGLDYITRYKCYVAALCPGETEVDWTTAYYVEFTTSRSPKLRIGGAVFGGGRMADIDGKTKVSIVNCESISAVYGGNDIAGQVKGAEGSTVIIGNNNTATGIDNQMYIGSVYGGGNGYYIYDENDPNDIAHATPAKFDTYKELRTGAMPIDLVGSGDTLKNVPTIVRTDIAVGSDNARIDSLFGGAKNAFVTKSGVGNTSTHITIDGGIVYALYGGNNYGGTLGDNSTHDIDINMTAYTLETAVENTDESGFGRDYGIRYLFGGGNRVPGQNVDIDFIGGQVDTLFGGGNAASVAAADVNVNCTFEVPLPEEADWMRWGNVISAAIYDAVDADNITFDRNYLWDNKGRYNIRCLFGGNNQADMGIVPNITLTSGCIGTVYGGGNSGAMRSSSNSTTIDANSVTYGTHVEVNSSLAIIDRIYGGCQQSDVDYSTWVKIQEGNVGYVFGGCNISGDVGSTRTNPSAASGTTDYYAVRGGCWVNMLGGHVYKNLYGGSDGFYHCNDDLHYISGINYTDKNYVGLYIPTHNETHVVMNGGTVLGNVYAGANLANVGFPEMTSEWAGFPVTSGIATVHMTGGKVVNNVFGGGNMASVYGINDVLVEGGTIEGALYGGNDRAGSVRKFDLRAPTATASDMVTSTGDITSYVHVTGKPYIGEVFGGGNGDYDYSENSDVPICGDPDLVKPIQQGTFVDINIDDGGYGEATGSAKDAIVAAGSGGGYIGTVYGGGDGVYVNGSITVFLNVKKNPAEDWSGEDNVGTIFGGNNKGHLLSVPDIVLFNGQVHDVYGGSNQGNMNGRMLTNLGGVSEYGSYVRLLKRYYPEGGSAAGYDVNAVVSGNVYGGCRLSDVAHNSLVLVEGGNHHLARIFGGNDISGTIYGTANVVIDSTSEVKEIYGGGNGLYTYHADGIITDENDVILTVLSPMPADPRPFCANTHVQLIGGICDGNIYAGGLAGNCGNTNLTVQGDTKIIGNIYGGGRGIVDSIGVGAGSCAVSHTRVGNVTGTATTLLHSMDPTSFSRLQNVYGGGHNSDCANTSIILQPTFTHSLSHMYGGCVAGNVSGTASIDIQGVDDGIHTTVDTLFGGNDFSGLVSTTIVNIASGRFHNVFGAGNGNYNYASWIKNELGIASLDDICVDTVPYSMDVTVNFNGGYYVGNVYGGGNLGLVGNRDMVPEDMRADDVDRNTDIGRININIHEPAFFARHVFAGARGVRDMRRTFFGGASFNTGATGVPVGKNVDNTKSLGKQLVYGQKVVNMDGGTINLSLYGGSESVDDGFPYECIGNEKVYYYAGCRLNDDASNLRRSVDHNSTKRPSSVINLLGGNIRKNVYGSGYQGNGYGSVYVNVGRRAINESPVWTNDYGGFSMSAYKPVIKSAGSSSTNPTEMVMGNDLILEASVYNGSDWGEAGDTAYFNIRGFYGGETNIFVDGDGYYTSANDPVAELQMPSMTIAFNLIGSGISTEGGDINRLITMRRYGSYYDCERLSRDLFSIQRADKVVLDSVFIHLKGEQDAFSAYTSSNYSFNRIDTLIFLQDNIVSIEAPGTYVGNLVSMKRPVPNISTNLLTAISTAANLFNDPSLMLANLISMNGTGTGNCNTGTGATIGTNCDQLDFCDKLPVQRGESGYSGNYNTLVMRNGSYMKLASFVDDIKNGTSSSDANHYKPDGKDDGTTYGHVRGWMYLVSEDKTQSYVYAADKVISSDLDAHPSWALANTSDGGFVGLCACENTSPFTNYENELNYEHVNSTYRSWRVGSYQGRRTRNIALVANAVPDDVLNYRLPSSGSLIENHEGEAATSGTGTYAINSTTGNDKMAYATAIMELPPSENGNFYVINEVIVDQDNGYQMQLVDQGYDAATGSIFSASAASANGFSSLEAIYGSTVSQNARNKTFGLTFSTEFEGSNFAQTSDGCWNTTSDLPSVTSSNGDSRQLYSGTDPTVDANRNHCWPISSISGNPFWSSVNGFLSRAVIGDGGVVPSIMFTLTYDTRLTNTLTRDVIFTIDEYDMYGNYVGPINVTVTISTVIREFTNLDATVFAMYNEGLNSEYSRIVTIPSSFMERSLWLKGIEWENHFVTELPNAEFPAPTYSASSISPTDPVVRGSGSTPADVASSLSRTPSDFFYMQSFDKAIEGVTVSDASRIDNGKYYMGNNLFSFTVSPSEHSSDKTNNHLAWMDINEDARSLDVYKTALDDYRLSVVEAGGDPGFYNNTWDFTQGSSSADATEDLKVYNKTRKYDSYNYNDATVDGDKLKTNLYSNPIYLGTLDGRSTAGIDVRLKYNGDYVYHDCLSDTLATVKLHLYWENTKFQNSEGGESASTDRGDIVLTIHLCTRDHGDTIYMAPGNIMEQDVVEGSNTQHYTVHSWFVNNPSSVFSFEHRSEVINNPDNFLNTFKEALSIYIEGDVLDIMETIPINNGAEATTIHGEDYNRIQIIRYSGSHAKFPTLACANRHPLIEVSGDGRLYMRNVWLNGSGCTRTKNYNLTTGYNHEREPAVLISDAPILYCHEHGEVTMSSNVAVINNFNRSKEQDWDYTTNPSSPSWVPVSNINGGAIALVKDLSTGIAPKLIMGNMCQVYDNLVVDWKAYYDKLMLDHPGETGTPTVALTQPLNYGGAIYVNGGYMQLGTLSSEGDNTIDISRNFYVNSPDITNAIRLRKKHGVTGEETLFNVYYLDTVRHPEFFRLSNIHLSREAEATNPVRRDALSDKIVFVSDFNNKSRVGFNKWFPGYKYNETGHYLRNSEPRDTIVYAEDRSNKPRVAELNFANKIFFNDSAYYYDNSKTRAANDYYTGGQGLADSLAARFVPIVDDYTAYHIDGTAYPAYNDQVWHLYTPSVSKVNFYLHRCSSFGAGVRLDASYDYAMGDSICYRWDKNATCVASTDTIITTFGGGFFPYTYQWYNDSLIAEEPVADMFIAKMKRIPIRRRTTFGNNSISTIGTSNDRNAMLRFHATHDTLVLNSLVQVENALRSTHFYTLEATDATGHCKANLPVMIRVAKVVPDDINAVNYYVDTSNFLRHRNPYASYPYEHKGDYSSRYLSPIPVIAADGTTVINSDADLFEQLYKDSKYHWAVYDSKYDEFMKVFKSDNQPNAGDPLLKYKGSDVVDGIYSIALADYNYYRIDIPGVDSSSFHDHAALDSTDNGSGYDYFFRNAKGEALYPYIYALNSDERSDTVGYEIRKMVGSEWKRFRINADHSTDVVISMSDDVDGATFEPVAAGTDIPVETDFWPARRVPYHYYDADGTGDHHGGIRRAGYTNVPMDWPKHSYNRGTLEERIKAESFSGKPYEDNYHTIALTKYYSNGDGTGATVDTIADNLYRSAMVPSYMRVYRAYHIFPSIEPVGARHVDPDEDVLAYSPDDVALANPLDLNTVEFCPGDIVQLVPKANNDGLTSNYWNFLAWDFDASADSVATFVVTVEHSLEDRVKNSPKAYFAPGEYWWEHVTSLPSTEHYVRHNNGDVTIKSNQGLAWLISVVNGYNGQNARSFRNNRIIFDMAADADMSQYKWTPVGNHNNPFEGEIVVASSNVGKVSGIIVNEQTVPLLGVFGYTKHAKIKDMVFDNTVIHGTSYVGGLIGYADTNTQVSGIEMNNSTLFGLQYTGGLVGQSYGSTLDGNRIKNLSIRGSAIYAGGTAGVIAGSYAQPRNSYIDVDIRNLSAIYFGGAVGRIEPTFNDQPNGKSNEISLIENNYIHIYSDGTSQRIGGIVGYGQYANVNNSYVYGHGEASDYNGGVVGYVGSNLSVSNCYYVSGFAKKAWGFTTRPNAVEKTTTFYGSGNNVKLTDRVDGYSNLTRALNRWVFAHGGDSLYYTWRSAHGNENSGYPVFGDPDIITVRDSVSQTVCDEFEWDGLTFTQSGRYLFHVVDSSDFLDSTFILNLTVNYGDSTNFVDSVLLGSSYSGFGLELSAAEIQQLFGDDLSREVMAFRYVDSLLTLQGCDSLVVVTLYIVNENVDIPTTTQQLNNIKIYPNPTRGIVNVEGDGLQTIEVYDNVSRRLLSREAKGTHERFDLSDKPAGAYFIRVRTASGTIVQKIIKK